MYFVRHSNREYKNDYTSKYGLDSGLSVFGLENAFSYFTDLKENGYIPQKIFSSPYLRCRQTAMIAKLVFQLDIDIEYIPLLGERFWKPINKSLTPITFDTHMLKPILFAESGQQFESRLKRFYSTHNEPGLYISHGYTIEKLAEWYNQKIEYPEPLGGFQVNDLQIIDPTLVSNNAT